MLQHSMGRGMGIKSLGEYYVEGSHEKHSSETLWEVYEAQRQRIESE